jgi:steroid delta-isomerase-like uncharacterized protein
MPGESETVMRRWFAEVWNDGRLESIDELFAPNGVAYGLAEGGADDVHGPAEFRRFVQGLLAEFSEFRVEIEDVVADGEKVAARWTATGRYQGTQFGPGRGQPVRMTGMSFGRVVNGQLVEGWNNWDIMGMARQLGAEPMVAKLLA